jgi:hypothetical protein
MTNQEGVIQMSEPTVDTNGILASMQLMLGMEPDYQAFNTDLIIHINTILSKLYQAGVGEEPFQLDLTDPYSSKWEDFIGNEDVALNMVKSYTYLNLRTLFDPPQNSFVLDALHKEAEELIWRIRVEADKWPMHHTTD